MSMFAPHFSQTMRELSESVVDRIADHAPMTVDLPVGEPSWLDSRRESVRMDCPGAA